MKTVQGSAVLMAPVTTYRKNNHRGSFKWGRRLLLAGLFLIVYQVSTTLLSNEKPDLSTLTDTQDVYQSRKLMSVSDAGSGNETEQGHVGVTWERCDFEKANVPYAFLPLYIFCIFLLFIAIAIICDDFFVPSLEAISEKLDLSEDVAGATFMAAGSSAPELFTSVAAVGVDSDVGIGTIVGSAMFNILIIVALSAALAGQTLYLDWRPLIRDATVYGFSIIMFIIFSWDAKFEWWEALILLLLYVMYIVIMKFNKYLVHIMTMVECSWCRNESRIEPSTECEGGSKAAEKTTEDAVAEGGSHHSHSSLHDEHKHRFVHSHRGELAGSFANRRRSSLVPHTNSQGTQNSSARHSSHNSANAPHGLATVTHAGDTINKTESVNSAKSSSTVEEEEASMVLIPFLPAIRTVPPDIELAREEGKIGMLKYVFKWILFVISFPFVVMFTWTIPNCSDNRKWYVVTLSFSMSILWIAIISFAMVTIVARVGCILNIDPFTMGLVVVAVGTSVPDCLSSILVARDGFGDMAVSNAIGSNVFDINLGLGLPFLIRIAIQKGAPYMLLGDAEMIAFQANEYPIAPHAKFGFMLLIVLVLAVLMFTLFRFRLSKWSGISFVVLYILFLVYSLTQELAPFCDHGKRC